MLPAGPPPARRRDRPRARDQYGASSCVPNICRLTSGLGRFLGSDLVDVVPRSRRQEPRAGHALGLPNSVDARRTCGARDTLTAQASLLGAARPAESRPVEALAVFLGLAGPPRIGRRGQGVAVLASTSKNPPGPLAMAKASAKVLPWVTQPAGPGRSQRSHHASLRGMKNSNVVHDILSINNKYN